VTDTFSRSKVGDTAGLIAHLQGHIRGVLDPLFSATSKVALLDFPNHSNVGDSAIWLGELAYLTTQKHLKLVYVADMRTYSKGSLTRVLGDGTILLHGGGNFGDTWERHQVFREQVITDFPNNSIIQLPVSAHFSSTDALERSRRVMNSHRDLTLVMRDTYSFAIVKELFSAKVLLCPDMAFHLGTLKRSKEPVNEYFWLKRTDKESSSPGSSTVFLQGDWLDEKRDVLLTAADLIYRLFVKFPNKLRFFWRFLPQLFQLLAKNRLQRGLEIVSSGKMVVTDRLHGHILCLLLGIPHILINNNNNKIKRYFEDWTSCSQLVTFCKTEDAAMQILFDKGFARETNRCHLHLE
jgi:exopolysaccharide biosynthesis predicted pyruvyltransferase EpsI